MWIKVWKRGEKARPSMKRARFHLTTPPIYGMLEFRNLIQGRAYLERYKDGIYFVILEWTELKGLENSSTLPDEINYLAHLFANAQQVDGEISDVYGFIGMIIGGLAVKGIAGGRQ